MVFLRIFVNTLNNEQIPDNAEIKFTTDQHDLRLTQLFVYHTVTVEETK